MHTAILSLAQFVFLHSLFGISQKHFDKYIQEKFMFAEVELVNSYEIVFRAYSTFMRLAERHMLVNV